MARRGLGKEDYFHKNLASIIKGYESYGKLNCSWWSYDASGENRALKTGQLLKAKGLRPGKADYEFRKLKGEIMYHIYLECKTETGKQSSSQKEFEETCKESMNDKYYIARSMEDAMSILEKEGIIDLL